MPLDKGKERMLSIRGVCSAPTDAGATSVGIWQISEDIRPEAEPALEDGQAKLIEQLNDYAQSQKLPDSHQYADRESRWLQTRGTTARFLRAESWNLEKAQKRIKDTMEWRREYKPDLIPPHEVRKEAEGGKIIVTGFTKDGMPVIYLRPARENTEPSVTQVRHMIFQLERAIDLMPENGRHRVCMVVDFKGTKARSSPPMKITKSVVTILQTHYVETLGRALILHLPWYMKSFFSAVSPFLDDATRNKLKMNPDLTDVIDKTQLDAAFGGDYHYVYRHDVYLPAICRYCGVAEDGTRTKDKAGPEEDYFEQPQNKIGMPGARPSFLSTSKGRVSSMLSAPQRRATTSRQNSASSEVLVEHSDEQIQRKRRRTWHLLCFSDAAVHIDEPETKSSRRRRPQESLPALSDASHKARTTAHDRNNEETNADHVNDPDETAELERHFKRGEQVPVSANDDRADIIHALRATAREELREDPIVPLTPAKDEAVEDATRQALQKLDENAPMRQATSDHATMQPLKRADTVGPDDLSFDVGNV